MNAANVHAGMTVLLVLATACCGRGGNTPGTSGSATTARPTASAARSDQPRAKGPPRIRANPSEKVCQLTGETDVETGQPTPNRTMSRFGLWGTDLGTAFRHAGKTWLVFGDSHPSGKAHGGLNPHCGDAIAYSTDTNGADCLDLRFVTHPSTKVFRSPAVEGFPLPCFGVPTGGISAGGKMYVWFAQIEPKAKPGGETGETVLSRSNDGGQGRFAKIYSLSTSRFLNVAAARLPAKQRRGLPKAMRGDAVLMFASGAYRNSQVYLAAVPAKRIEHKSAIRYFEGLEPGTGKPRWGKSEKKAASIAPLQSPCVGELSVHFNEPLGLWVMLYNCNRPSGIIMQVARHPWGPWSPQQVIFQAKSARCKWMLNVCRSGQGECCTDHALPHLKDGAGGGAYGPYVVDSLTQSAGPGKATIYWVVSTWVPYNTVLMRTTLQRLD